MWSEYAKSKGKCLFPFIGSFIFLLMPFVSVFAQDAERFGLLPMFFLNAKIGKRGDFQGVLMPLVRFSDDTRAAGTGNIIRFDAQFSLSVRLTPVTSFAIGYLTGILEPNSPVERFENRLWQQLAFSHRHGKFRHYNRVRLEQRFIDEDFFLLTELVPRLRVMSGLDFPLNGTTADPKEFYFNINAEFFRTMSKSVPSKHEYRSYVGLGYIFSKSYSLEAGLEYRGRRLNEQNDLLNSLFLRTSFVVRR
jgi:hypothetical protein